MSESNTDYSKASNNEEEIIPENHNSVGLDLCKLYNEIVKTLVKIRQHFPLTIRHENETSRDNLLSYLALRRNNLERGRGTFLIGKIRRPCPDRL